MDAWNKIWELASRDLDNLVASSESRRSLNLNTGLTPPNWKSLFTPEMEKEFQSWHQERARNLGLSPNPDDPRYFYDARGAWLSGIRDTTGHIPDTYKLPGHPWFSPESIYYQPKMKAGKWKGEKYLPIK